MELYILIWNWIYFDMELDMELDILKYGIIYFDMELDIF